MGIKYFRIDQEKETKDSLLLADIIINDSWIDQDTILVVCSPDYSSICSQIVNHKLSQINDNQLLERLYLEIPGPTMNQIWDNDSLEYQLFDRYLKTWVNTHLYPGYKYLFIESSIGDNKNFNKIKQLIKNKTDNVKFACLYVEQESTFNPDYYVEKYRSNLSGGILFDWENPNNPNWNY